MLNEQIIEGVAAMAGDPSLRDSVLTLANTGVPYEANLAIEDLRSAGVGERGILDVINLRAFIEELGSPPLRLGFDFDTLVRDGTLASVAPGQYAARLQIPTKGEVLVEVAGEVKTCEWIRFVDGFDVFELNPRGEGTLVHPKLVGLVLRHPNLLRGLQCLYQGFGLVFNPREYMTVESFVFERASDTLESLSESMLRSAF